MNSWKTMWWNTVICRTKRRWKTEDCSIGGSIIKRWLGWGRWTRNRLPRLFERWYAEIYHLQRWITAILCFPCIKRGTLEKYFRLFSLDSFKNCNLAAIKQLTMKVSKTLLLLVLTFFLVGCSQDDSEVEGTSSVLSVSVSILFNWFDKSRICFQVSCILYAAKWFDLCGVK